jgi:hypothetical protein
MSNLRSLTTTQPKEFAISAVRFPHRIAICVLLTAFNVAVVALFGGTLYGASAGFPLRFAGVTLLFAALSASLVRVWIVSLRRDHAPPAPTITKGESSCSA